MVRESAFAQFASEFVWQRHASDPVTATAQGVHDFDHLMPDLTAAGFSARDVLADHWLMRLESIEPWGLGVAERADLNFAIGKLKGEVALRPFARWRKQPSLYSDAVIQGAYYALLREELPLEERLGKLAQRLALAPAALAAGRANCDPALVPAIYAEIAEQSARGGAEFLRTLPEAAGPVESEDVKRDIARTALAAASELEAYAAWCHDLIPGAVGTTAIGREAFDALLKDTELLEYDADTLAAFGDELYAETETKLNEVAAELGSTGWREAVEKLRAEHPSAEDLVTFYRREMERSRHATVVSDIVTMPSDEWLDVEPTPPFARPTYPYAAYVGMAAFGEKRVGKFWVTRPADDDDAARIEAMLAGHPRAGIAVIACHEGYPGHHLQFATAHKNASVVRKHFRTSVAIEGWGLYVEDLMTELGYLASAETRLLRLRDLLWRAARVKVDVGLSTGTMTVAEAVNHLVANAGLEAPNAEAEVRRYTLTPVQPSTYAIGRAAILKMRVRARERGWGMKQFHDKLLAVGAIPPKLAEEEIF